MRTSSRCRNGHIPSKRCRYLRTRAIPDGPARAAKLDLPDCHAGPPVTVAPVKGCVWFQTGGASRDRTDDLMLAKQPLSQLSYGPNSGRCVGRGRDRGDSLARPTGRPHTGAASQGDGRRRRRLRHQNGGPGTTRTSDLTLIRGAL